MPNRADYTNALVQNALVQEIAQQELARRQSRAANTTNRLVDQIALPDASQPFTRQGPPPPMPGVGGSPYPQELAPSLSELFDPNSVVREGELGQAVNPDVLPVEALTPKQEPAGIAQWVKDAMGDLFSRKQTDRGAKIETIMRVTNIGNEEMFMGMTDEELDSAYIKVMSDFEQGGYQHIPARRAE